MKYTVIIPTAIDKLPWLERTITGISMQSIVPTKILVGVDTKPWKKWDIQLEEKFPTVETHVFDPPRKFKRQHQIVNHLVDLVPDGEAVLITDDDYWMTSSDIMSQLMDNLSTMSVVMPKEIVHVKKGRFPSEDPMPTSNNRLQYYKHNDEEHVLDRKDSIDDNDGHNPFAGHPKLMMSEDFKMTGGFDTVNFNHYWWCDTDFYYRTRSLFEFKQINTPDILHFHHTKYIHELFQQQNTRRFFEKYNGLNMITSRHLEIIHEIRDGW